MFHDPASLYRLDSPKRIPPASRALFSLPAGFRTTNDYRQATGAHTAAGSPYAYGDSGTRLLWLWAVVVAVLAVVWYFFGAEIVGLSAVVVPKISYEKRRGFQPPWYTVQHVDCPTHGRTTWRASGAIGFRRIHGNRGSRLVPIRETFPGHCPKCTEERAGVTQEGSANV